MRKLQMLLVYGESFIVEIQISILQTLHLTLKDKFHQVSHNTHMPFFFTSELSEDI